MHVCEAARKLPRLVLREACKERVLEDARGQAFDEGDNALGISVAERCYPRSLGIEEAEEGIGFLRRKARCLLEERESPFSEDAIERSSGGTLSEVPRRDGLYASRHDDGDLSHDLLLSCA
jgi:hypothetical protein